MFKYECCDELFYDYGPVNVHYDSVDGEEKPATRVRSEFPETWIWEIASAGYLMNVVEV